MYLRMCSHEYYTLSGEVANKYLGNLKNYVARSFGYVATCETKYAFVLARDLFVTSRSG